MKRLVAIGVLLLCLTTLPVARAAEDRNAQIKAEMVQNYLLWQEAYKLRDAERIISFESPDFTYVVFPETVLNKEMADVAWRDTMNTIQKVHDARIEIKKLAIEPNRIVIASKHYLDADTLSPTGQHHRIQATFNSREIWVLYDGIWMLKRIEQPRPKLVVDGKLRS